jgi:uncharacterized protein (DUF983 family)
MLKRGSKLYAIRKSKCPKCHQGDLFRSSLLSGEGVYNMYKKCVECDQDFEMEPGFYWGAMYIGYGLFSFYMLGTIALLFFGTDLTLNQSFGTTLIGGILLIPYIARRSRVQWINIAVRYNKRIADKVAERKNPEQIIETKK